MDEQVQHIKGWLGTGSINIFGVPFAGKDTQGERLAEILGATLVGGGDILRSYADQSAIEPYMASGDLIPTDLFIKIVVSHFSSPLYAGKSLILSSVGRLKGEETTVVQAAAESGHPIKAAIMLTLGEEDVWKRFEAAKELNDRGDREDDSRTALENRLEKFRTLTQPVIEYYRGQGLLVEVDGSLSREEVTNEIIKSVGLFATTH